MAAELSQAAWVRGITDQDLIDQVGEPTWHRGRAYADQSKVRTLVTGSGGQILLATVLGTHREHYQTIVHRRQGVGSDWMGQCSCPVRSDCKHAVAVILNARRALISAGGDEAPDSDWEQTLAALVPHHLRIPASGGSTAGPSGPSGAAHAERYPLGLHFSLVEAGGSPQIRLRPVRPGKASRWVRSGVSWRDLTNPWTSRSALPSHQAVLAQMVSVAQGGGHYAYYSSAELDLSDLGALTWALLERCTQVGIALVPGPGLSSIHCAQGRVRLSVDLNRTERGEVVLQPLAQFDEPLILADGEAHQGTRHLLLGDPPHGVASLDDSGALVIWPVQGTPSAELAAFFRRQEPVRIPPKQTSRFFSHYYPGLTRAVTVSSSDDSIPTIGEVGPALHLALTVQPEHHLLLEWSVSYSESAGQGPGLSLLPAPGDPPRDEAAEAEVVARVVELLGGVGSPLLSPGWTYPATPLTVSGQQAARFVMELLPGLRESPDVQVVVHGDLPDYAEAQDAPLVTLETTKGEADDWFDLHVRVTIGGEQVILEDLLAALATGQQVMLLPSGTFFSLHTPELDALRRLIDEARELNDRPAGPGTVRITPYQAGLWEDLMQIGVVTGQDVRWQQALDALLDLGDADRGRAALPDTVLARLRPYQQEGFDWLARLWDAGLGGILADDMGLGKTLQILAMIARGEHRGDLSSGPVLVVTPTSVVGTWAQEAARFIPELRVASITATRRRRGGADLAETIGAADVVITSYTLLRLEAEDYHHHPWSAVVLDEAQTVKNFHSATYRAVRGLAPQRRFAITGTPMENSLMDLWAMLSVAAPGLFPRSDHFTQRYRKPIESGAAGSEILARLRRRIRPFMLRRTKGEVAADLPPKVEQTWLLDLSPSHRKIYERHLARERQRVLGLLEDMDKNRLEIFRALTVLRQLALDPSLYSDEHQDSGSSAKVVALVDRLKELAAEGHRALVFSSFTSYLAVVRTALEAAGIGYCYLDGSTRDRARVIDAFRQGQDPAFLISLRAGGFGLTLTEADYVFVLDPWWNPATEAQAVDRAHRIGQTRAVHVYRMVSTGTIEEKVVALQERKRELFATVIDAGEFRSGMITAQDIEGMLES